MTPWGWVIILAALACGAFAALQRSLVEFSRARLEQRLAKRGNQAEAEATARWISDQRDELALAAAIWRVAFLALLFVAVLAPRTVEVRGAEAVDPTLTWLVSSLIGILLWIWIVMIGLARALAEHAASAVVARSAWMLPILSVISRPLVIPLEWLDEVVRRLVGAERGAEDDLEEEIRQVIEESERDGAIGETEMEMFEALVDFRSVTVEEAMTPRIDVVGIEIHEDFEVIKRKVLEEGHSRYPVYDGDLDHIEGVLYVKDLLNFVGREVSSVELKPLLREALMVPESRKISDLLQDFRTHKVHMALVLDEYGGTTGLVTIEDVVEEIVGDIRDEHDTEEEPVPTFVRNADGTIDVDARMHTDDVNDELDLNLPEDGDYDTIGGWIFSSVGRVPRVDDEFTLGRIQVKILEAEKTRVSRVRLRVLEEGEVAELTDLNGNAK